MRPVLYRLLSQQRPRFLVGGFTTIFGYLQFAMFYSIVFTGLRLDYVFSLVASYAITIKLAFYLYR